MGCQCRKKGLSHLRPYPDIIFLRRASNPICLCLSAGSHRIICTYVLLEKRRRKKRALFDWYLLPKRRKTHFSKCHMTNGHVFHGSSTHNSKKRRSLCLVPQQRSHIKNHFSYAESVQSRVLHSIGSTLFTATNATPYERFLSFFRRSSSILVAKTRTSFSTTVHKALEK